MQKYIYGKPLQNMYFTIIQYKGNRLLFKNNFKLYGTKAIYEFIRRINCGGVSTKIQYNQYALSYQHTLVENNKVNKTIEKTWNIWGNINR